MRIPQLRSLEFLVAASIGLSALAAPKLSHARPIILEESVQAGLPTNYAYVSRLALEGDHLLVLMSQPTSYEMDYYAVFHYEREANGYWAQRGRVATASNIGIGESYSGLSMDGTIAAFTAETDQLQVLERSGSTWTVTPLILPREYASYYASNVRVVDGTIAVGSRTGDTCQILLLRKDSTGAWRATQTLEQPAATCEGDLDILGPSVMEFTGAQAYMSFADASIHSLAAGVWQRAAAPVAPPVVMNSEIALRTGANPRTGDVLYLDRRDASGAWSIRNTLRSEESYADVRTNGVLCTYCSNVAFPVLVRGNRAFTAAPFNDLRGDNAGSVNVFTRPSGSVFTHAATLVASPRPVGGRAGSLVGPVAVDDAGARVVAAGRNTDDRPSLYFFDVPATLPRAVRVEDTFEDANAAGWTPWGLASWSVVASGNSYVYRQTNVQGGARAILDAPTTQNQSIQADVTLNPAGSTSWGGLIVRYTDAQNFNYLFVAPNQPIQIRRMVGGAYQAIASAPFNLVAGQQYRFRLQAIGKQLRAYVDGRLVLEASDQYHTGGRAGLTMWKTRADYDNVVVSTSPFTYLHEDAFDQTVEELLTPWATSPANTWSHRTTGTGATVFYASALSADARAVNGAPAVDQIVSADVTPLSFNTNGWVGLVARYRNNLNYYYVLLTRDNRASLRTRVNGQDTVIEEVQMPVTAATTYRVRFEVIGNSLRLYVNGQLRAEGRSSALSNGRYGLATNRATAQFDNFSAARP